MYICYNTITLCIFFPVSLNFTVRTKLDLINFKKTVTLLPFGKSGHRNVLSAGYFLLFDSRSHIVGFIFFFFLFRHLELFVSVGNESVFLTHKCLKFSYFRKMTEKHERCCHLLYFSATSVTHLK